MVLGADRALALTYLPVRHRAAVAAIWAIDGSMGDVVRTSSQPMLGAIRLAWWRERLEELDGGASAPAEPTLQAIASELLPLGVSGSELAALEGPWLRLFDNFPWGLQVAEALWFRGRHLFSLAARLIGSDADAVANAGGVWAIVDAARHCSDRASRALLIGEARTFARGLASVRFPAAARPLTMLAALAVRDALRPEPFEPEGTPGRAAAMLRHRLSGRLPDAS